MKYKDRGFIKHQEKQRNGDYDYYANKNERRIRREREAFYQKFLLGKVDKFWWKHLSDSDKDEKSDKPEKENKLLTTLIKTQECLNKKIDDELNLGTILSRTDGIGNYNGLIIVATTNCKDK